MSSHFYSLRHQTIIHPYTLLTHASSTPSLAYPPRKKEKKKQNSLPPTKYQNFTKISPPLPSKHNHNTSVYAEGRGNGKKDTTL